jgi:hypothetical protein
MSIKKKLAIFASVIIVILLLPLLFRGCSDDRKITDLYEHFKNRYKTGSRNIRGSLMSLSISDKECSISIKVQKFPTTTEAKAFYNQSVEFRKFPFIRRSGVWVLYTENFNNKNFLDNSELKDRLEDVFYEW